MFITSIKPFCYQHVVSNVPIVSFNHLIEKGADDAIHCTRPLIETMLRKFVRACPNVELRAGTVVGIEPDPERKYKVESVKYKVKDVETIQSEDAVFVVGMFVSISFLFFSY